MADEVSTTAADTAPAAKAAPAASPAPEEVKTTPVQSLARALKNEFGDGLVEAEAMATRILAWMEREGHKIAGAL